MQLAKGFVFSVNTPGLIVFGQIDDVLCIGLAVCLFNEGLLDFDFYFAIVLFRVWFCIFQDFRSYRADVEMGYEDARYKELRAVLAL